MSANSVDDGFSSSGSQVYKSSYTATGTGQQQRRRQQQQQSVYRGSYSRQSSDSPPSSSDSGVASPAAIHLPNRGRAMHTPSEDEVHNALHTKLQHDVKHPRISGVFFLRQGRCLHSPLPPLVLVRIRVGAAAAAAAAAVCLLPRRPQPRRRPRGRWRIRSQGQGEEDEGKGKVSVCYSALGTVRENIDESRFQVEILLGQHLQRVLRPQVSALCSHGRPPTHGDAEGPGRRHLHRTQSGKVK